MVEHLDVAVMLHAGETGAILDVNRGSERVFGYSKAELLSMEIGDFTAPSPQFTHEDGVRRIRAAAAGDPQVYEWQIEHGSGEIRWITVHLNPTTLDGETHVLAEVHDITEYKARTRRLRLLNRVVRHNLRNDMTVLMGTAEDLKAEVDDESLDSDVAIESKVETILDIAADVGNLSKSIHQIEKVLGMNGTHRGPINLREVTHNRVDAARTQYPEANFDFDGPTDVWVTAGEGLQFAIAHALSNAIEHNDRTRPTVSVSVGEESNRGVIHIVDDGPPIPQIEIDVLTDEERIGDTYHGSGIGLWIMQWCVDSLGGELTFEEKTPRGNVVRFSLPTTSSPP